MAWLDGKATHHCAVFQGDEHGASERQYKNCKINPGHNNFIRAADFKKEHLPIEFRTQEAFNHVRYCIDATVRVVVTYTSRDRPDQYPGTDKPYPCSEIRGNENLRRLGTGFVVECCQNASRLMGFFCTSTGLYTPENCPCMQCNPDVPNQRENTGPKTFKGSKKESYCFIVFTATHVIYDEHEARKAVFELFYDSDDRKDVQFLYGVGIFCGKDRNLETDRCCVLCVTHDDKLARTMNSIISSPFATIRLPYGKWYDFDIGILASHPHGMSKRISFGKVTKIFLVGRQNYLTKSLIKRGSLRFTAQQNETGEYRDLDQPSYHELLNESPKFDAASGKSGAVYLQSDVTAVPPPDQHIEMCLSKDGRLWNRLPFGTELITENRRKYKVPMMEVHINNISFVLGMGRDCYITYDMGSCPGSSGAHVIYDLRSSMMSWVLHFGAREGENVSGLGMMEQFKPFLSKS